MQWQSPPGAILLPSPAPILRPRPVPVESTIQSEPCGGAIRREAAAREDELRHRRVQHQPAPELVGGVVDEEGGCDQDSATECADLAAVDAEVARQDDPDQSEKCLFSVDQAISKTASSRVGIWIRSIEGLAC